MSSTLRVSVFDYGAGNMHSLLKSLESPETDVRLETDLSKAVTETDALVLPGVGAFATAAGRMSAGRNAARTAIEKGLPCLGICLGMQLLFDDSTEGTGKGLGILAGSVNRLRAARVPQIGWNTLDLGSEPDALFRESALDMAYFANSFVGRPQSEMLHTVIAWSDHDGDRFPAAVRVGHVVGVQFHPEKSSANGVRFIQAFLDEARGVRDAGFDGARAGIRP